MVARRKEPVMNARSPAPAAMSFAHTIHTSRLIKGVCSLIVLLESRTKQDRMGEIDNILKQRSDSAFGSFR
jgi:hypothetical protein